MKQVQNYNITKKLPPLLTNYLQLIDNLCPKDIICLGQKVYLDGMILDKKDIGIANFREYRVKEGSVNYSVQTPLWHLVLTTNDSEKIQELVSKFSYCDCAYYDQVGFCKHLVAVFESINNEFFSNEKIKQAITPKKDIINSENLIQNLFDFDRNKWQQQSLIKLEQYFTKSSNSLAWWEFIVLEIKKQKLTEFKNTIVKILESKLKIYENEKKVIPLLNQSLILDFDSWFENTQSISDKLTERNYYQFWSQTWRVLNGISSNKDLKNNSVLNIYLSQKDDQFKSNILELLKENYQESPQLWLQFVMDSRYEDFIIKNIDSYDPELLLKIIEILPENREKIEQKLAYKVRIWIDFLMSGDYGELQTFLNNWKILGKSYYFEKTLEYIKANHSKKRSLIKFVEGL